MTGSFVLINGVATVVPLDREAALAAGYVLVDDGASSPTTVTPTSPIQALIAAPKARDRQSQIDFLRSLAQSKGAAAPAPEPVVVHDSPPIVEPVARLEPVVVEPVAAITEPATPAFAWPAPSEFVEGDAFGTALLDESGVSEVSSWTFSGEPAASTVVWPSSTDDEGFLSSPSLTEDSSSPLLIEDSSSALLIEDSSSPSLTEDASSLGALSEERPFSAVWSTGPVSAPNLDSSDTELTLSWPSAAEAGDSDFFGADDSARTETTETALSSWQVSPTPNTEDVPSWTSFQSSSDSVGVDDAPSWPAFAQSSDSVGVDDAPSWSAFAQSSDSVGFDIGAPEVLATDLSSVWSVPAPSVELPVEEELSTIDIAEAIEPLGTEANAEVDADLVTDRPSDVARTDSRSDDFVTSFVPEAPTWQPDPLRSKGLGGALAAAVTQEAALSQPEDLATLPHDSALDSNLERASSMGGTDGASDANDGHAEALPAEASEPEVVRAHTTHGITVASPFPVLEPQNRPPVLTAQASTMISCHGLVASHGSRKAKTTVLNGIDLTVRTGEFVVITGRSGTGKSTLLSCLAGLHRIDAGDVDVNGVSVGRGRDADIAELRASKVGYIHQDLELLDELTAVENVELPLLMNGWDRSEARSEAEAALTLVGVTRGMVRPAELSGGERRRAAIARALVGEPSILWADEPTSGVDPETSVSIFELLFELCHDGLTVVAVTHDPVLLRYASTRYELVDGRLEAR